MCLDLSKQEYRKRVNARYINSTRDTSSNVHTDVQMYQNETQSARAEPEHKGVN